MSESASIDGLGSRKQYLQYVLAGGVSLLFVVAAIRYPELSGIERSTDYLFLVAIVGYLFVLASDRLRQSRYYPLSQASFFLVWGGYNVSHGRLGLLTMLLLGGGSAVIIWETYRILVANEHG